jgi:hypothetical protein
MFCTIWMMLVVIILANNKMPFMRKMIYEWMLGRWRSFFDFKYAKQGLLSLVLLVMMMFSLIRLMWAATPDPGHPWSQIGDGNFGVAPTSTLRTYIFPDQSATVLTDAAVVTVPQGGTGTSSLTGVIVGNGTSPLTAMNAPLGGDFFMRTDGGNVISNKTINASDNTFTASGIAVGDLVVGDGYSVFKRLARGSAGQLLRVNSGQTDLEWVSGGGVAGSDTQLQYNNSGSLGASSSLTWDQSSQALTVNGNLVLVSSSVPSASNTGTIKMYSESLARRVLPAVMDDQGAYSVLQPSIYQNDIFLVTACNASSYCVIGTSMTSASSGSPSDSNVATEALFSNQINTGSNVPTNYKAYCTNGAQYYRGSLTTGRNGYFVFFRIGSQNNGAHDSAFQYFAGLTDRTETNVIAASDPVGSRSAFVYVNDGSGDSNWILENKAGGTVSRVDTGMSLVNDKVYDLYLYNPPTGSTVSWRVDNLTDGTSAEGSSGTSLPTSTVAMRACFGVANKNSGSTHSMLFNKMYIEVPR